LFGKPGNVREFDNWQKNVRENIVVENCPLITFWGYVSVL